MFDINTVTQTDVQACGRREKDHGGNHDRRRDQAGCDKNKNHRRHDFSQPSDILHTGDGGGYGKEDQRNDCGKDQIQEDIAQGFEAYGIGLKNKAQNGADDNRSN